MSIYPMHKETCNPWKPGVRLFYVAVHGGWGDWSKWSHCTKNVNGIQMRTRQCVNPKPQFGGKLCTDANATAMRGCTDISGCRQGIWQILMNNLNLFLILPPHRAFSWSVAFIAYLHGLKLSATLLFIGLYTKRYWGAHRSFDAHATQARHTREIKRNN